MDGRFPETEPVVRPVEAGARELRDLLVDNVRLQLRAAFPRAIWHAETPVVRTAGIAGRAYAARRTRQARMCRATLAHRQTVRVTRTNTPHHPEKSV